jgi:glycosyltransferase involved in cell wall biosynthesis
MWLRAAGHDVLACVTHWPEIPLPIKQLVRQGAIVAVRPRARSATAGIAPTWGQILEFQPDIVCISQGAAMCGVDWMLRCLEAAIPYAAVCQANCEEWWPDDSQAAKVRTAYGGCLHAGFMSQRNRHLLETQIGEPLPMGEVIRNPFLVPYNMTLDWPEASEPIRLACVGRLEPKAKGQDLIIEVMAAEKWRSRGVHVSFFGSGRCAENLRRLVALHRLESSMTFAGHVADVTGIWRTHHALLLPSRYEGLPLSLVEAMLCGRIGIVTDVAGNTEILEDDVTGFVAAAPTAGHLDAALERAWIRRKEWREMGRVAGRSIREHVPPDPAALYAQKLLALSGWNHATRP